MITKENIEAMHRLTKNNATAIEQHGAGTCICCKSVSPANLITEVIADEMTAVCPQCGVDALIPTLSNTVLELMHEYYFGDSS